MNRRRLVAVLMYCFAAFTLLSGCTHSIDVSYQADAVRLTNASALEQVTVGVAKFEDKSRRQRVLSPRRGPISSA